MKSRKDMNDVHRALLFNQYKILSVIESDEGSKSHYRRMAEAFQNGYEMEYGDLGLYPSFGEKNAQEVRDTLDLYWRLHNSYENLSPTEKQQIEPQSLKFQGYDGKSDREFVKYTRFLAEGNAKEWLPKMTSEDAKRDNYDSRSDNSRKTYQARVNLWKKLGSKKELSLNDMIQILTTNS